MKYSVPKKIYIGFHNGSNYDYHFIIKELAGELEKQFNFLGENIKKYITFTVLMQREVTNIDKNEVEITKPMYHKLQFIDSASFMANTLSSFVNNLSVGIHKIKRKHGRDDKKCLTCGIKYKDLDCFLEYTNLKDVLAEYKCLSLRKNHQQTFDEKLRELLIHTSFLTMITISLFYYCENVLTLMNIWMIGKNSMKYHYVKRMIFTAT